MSMPWGYTAVRGYIPSFAQNNPGQPGHHGQHGGTSHEHQPNRFFQTDTESVSEVAGAHGFPPRAHSFPIHQSQPLPVLADTQPLKSEPVPPALKPYATAPLHHLAFGQRQHSPTARLNQQGDSFNRTAPTKTASADSPLAPFGEAVVRPSSHPVPAKAGFITGLLLAAGNYIKFGHLFMSAKSDPSETLLAHTATESPTLAQDQAKPFNTLA